MKNGFTLIELSIVIVIVGLLAGGVLVGQSLILNAQINRLASNLLQYDIAINNFHDRFKQIPGDSSFFTPSGATDNSLSFGDNNGDGTANSNPCNGQFSNREADFFWAHLTQAKMLSDNYQPRATRFCGASEDTNLEDYRPSYEIGDGSGFISSTKTFATSPLSLFSSIRIEEALSLINKLGGEAFSSNNQVGIVYTLVNGEFNCGGMSNGSGMGDASGVHSCNSNNSNGITSLTYSTGIK